MALQARKEYENENRYTQRKHYGETRVAATPKTVGQLRKLGFDVAVESGAGERASFTDELYITAGAIIVNSY